VFRNEGGIAFFQDDVEVLGIVLKRIGGAGQHDGDRGAYHILPIGAGVGVPFDLEALELLSFVIDLNFDHGLGVDGLDDQASIGLTVADGLALIGFALVLGDADFLAKALLLDFAVDGSAFDVWSTNFGLFSTDEEDFLDFEFGTGFHVELLDIDLVADFDLDLLSASLDDCVHVFSSYNFALFDDSLARREGFLLVAFFMRLRPKRRRQRVLYTLFLKERED